VFLLLVRRVLLCRLKRSVLLQQHSLIHKFMGIARWTRRGLNAFDWQNFINFNLLAHFLCTTLLQSSPGASSKEPVRRASLSICPMCCNLISLLITTYATTVLKVKPCPLKSLSATALPTLHPPIWKPIVMCYYENMVDSS
jgi:hypothetical protein